MNLKEAFQMQKALSRLMEEAASYLDDTDNIMTVTEKHLRSKVVPEQALMEEKERLGRAITAAKAAIPLNFDTAAEENKARRRFLRTLAHMAEQRSESRMRRGAGRGYVFNKDGNQTPYCYDIEVVKTIDYDRNAARRMQDALAKTAADTSRALDEALVRTEVDFALQLPIPASTISEDPAERLIYERICGNAGSALAEIIELLEGK